MLFSYNWLQSFFNKKLPEPKKLAEILTMKAFEVEGVKKISKDWVLDIDVLPNRAPDCLSHFGIAREIGAILGLSVRSPEYKVKEYENLKSSNFIDVKVENKDDCLRYCARVVLGVKVKKSPKWLVEKLKICGLKPINNIVDVTNYIMLETGQPLHAFDLDKIEGKKIVVKRAKKGEKILTLDNIEYNLDEDVLVIADKKEPIAIAGIKGGKKAEITNSTKNIVLESANFDQVLTKRASLKLNLITDASRRFSYGLDPNLTLDAINRAVFLIQKLAGGKILKEVIDFYPKKISPKKIELSLEKVRSILGIKISYQEIFKILKSLGFKILTLSQDKVLIEIPTFRLDIEFQEDLIEEIGRLYGYEKIPSQFPLSTFILPEKNIEIFWGEKIKDILKEIGFCEVLTYSFLREDDIKNFSFQLNEVLEIKNPVSLEYQFLRPSLIPNLLKVVKKNEPYFSEIKIFELGKIFKKEKSKIKEKKQVTGLILGEKFLEAKGVIDLLFEKLGIAGLWYDSYKPTPKETKLKIWQKNKIAEVKVDHQEIGFLGEISEEILEKYRIKNKVTVFDLDFEKISKIATEEVEYEEISPFPAAIRDISVLVPQDVLVEDVVKKIQFVSPLIRDVDLFDIYESEELGEGKKSLAFHVIFQAKDHTLSPKELEELQNKVIEELEKEEDWKVRRM